MNADVAHTQRTRLFDEGDADRGVVELPTDALRAPLGVALPCFDRVAAGCVFHELERIRRGRIGHNHGVEEEPVGTLHALDESTHAVGLFEREWVALRQLRHEREDSEVGITVHKHVLDELFGREAVDRIVVATGSLGIPVLACIRSPLARRIDHVGLDIEDELVTGEGAPGSGALVGRLFGQPKTAACVALRCERLVKRSEGRGGRTKRLQKGTLDLPRFRGVLSVWDQTI